MLPWQETAECPPDELLASWAQGELSRRSGDALTAHVDACPTCQQVLGALLRLKDTQTEVQLTFERELPAQPSELLRGRWVVGALLYRGLRSVVFEASDRTTGAPCVVKFAATGLASHLEHFKLGSALAQVRATGVPRVLQAVRDATTPYWVLERLHGVTLDTLGPLSPAQWAGTARELVAAISRLKAARLRHGALSTRRVFLERSRVVLLGFALPHESDTDDALALTRMLAGIPVTGRATLARRRVEALANSPPPDVLKALKAAVALG